MFLSVPLEESTQNTKPLQASCVGVAVATCDLQSIQVSKCSGVKVQCLSNAEGWEFKVADKGNSTVKYSQGYRFM